MHSFVLNMDRDTNIINIFLHHADTSLFIENGLLSESLKPDDILIQIENAEVFMKW